LRHYTRIKVVMTHYRLSPSRAHAATAISIALLLCAVVGGAIYEGKLWVRDHVFPPPDPIELRHRIETAGAWPVMIRVAELRLEGKTISGKDEDAERSLRTTRMNGISPFKTGDTVDALFFSFGGADNEYGVMVCRPGETVSKYRFRYAQRWGDGIWYVADNAPRVPRVVHVQLPR
jgi:hypothetical protein